jgi:hypothetical protein
MDPVYQETEEEGRFRLSPRKIDYAVAGEVVAPDADAYSKYAVLNSHKKAVQLKQLPRIQNFVPSRK